MSEKQPEKLNEQEMAGVHRLLRTVRLVSVRLVQISARTNFPANRPAGQSGRLTNMLGWDAKNIPSELPNSLVVHAEGHFAVKEDPQREQPEPDAEAHLTVELVYELPGEVDANDADKDRFAKLNGIFNAWPYFRAELFGLFPSLGLPAYTLPIYRFSEGVAVPSEKPSPSATDGGDKAGGKRDQGLSEAGK